MKKNLFLSLAVFFLYFPPQFNRRTDAYIYQMKWKFDEKQKEIFSNLLFQQKINDLIM